MKFDFRYTDQFDTRHIGPSETEEKDMLKIIGVSTLDELINKTVPENIRLKAPLKLPKAVSEYKFLKGFKKLAQQNNVMRSFIGMGYHNTVTPGVILRNILENPGWYTAYTPYQAEIAQGRLEALINYQTMVTELTGMEIANASLLDEATAAAEAMTMFFASRKGVKKSANKYYVSDGTHPQTIDVLRNRAIPLGIDVVVSEIKEKAFTEKDLFGSNFFGAHFQYPDTNGEVVNLSSIIKNAQDNNLLVAVAADLMSLTILTPPGEMGADVVLGSTQRFGVPVGYGGPHAAYFATRESFKRQLPGRIIGASQDAHGNLAYRMALQTREQHIRREKATSNICTAQVLLAVIAGAYAVYHGSEGLKKIGQRIHALTRILDHSLTSIGIKQVNKNYFDTIKIAFEDTDLLKSIAENEGVNFRYYDNGFVGISLDETVDQKDLETIIRIFQKANNQNHDQIQLVEKWDSQLPASLKRSSAFMQQTVFNKYHSEHEMLRYLKRLENKDLSLAHSMISLGSCTMKLNATAEMIPVTWEEFGSIHPFAPVNQTKAYKELFEKLNQWLCEITGFDEVSFQPNSGAQGEYAGLMVIRDYLKTKGESFRNVALIPTSAHGTNPASAAMAGMKIVLVGCDERGNIDVADLKAKAKEHEESLAVLMVTYPSTHGVFEESIVEMCEIVHQHGGQVYMDGANMNAQVGLTSPANIGADVCHLNLHKTFCIPHGGGGPGVGPIGVAKHLIPFLPNHSVIDLGYAGKSAAVSAAPYGSASILPISYAYIAMMGGDGLTRATKTAILNANYIKSRLEKHYPILYTGSNGYCAHEMIVDFRQFKQSVGVEVEDVAKRLMDYGFHSPTVSFPVAGTLMIEPTESETKAELDRFCDALISIYDEIREIESGDADAENNVLKNAPHTAEIVMSDSWDKPYSREKAAFPLKYLKTYKFWPTVSRIDGAYGDRNLMCTCAPISDYA